MRIHDISQPLGMNTATWPGDRAVDIDWTLSIERGDSVNVAALTTSVHVGTHVDGFRHITRAGETAAQERASVTPSSCRTRVWPSAVAPPWLPMLGRMKGCEPAALM